MPGTASQFIFNPQTLSSLPEVWGRDPLLQGQRGVLAARSWTDGLRCRPGYLQGDDVPRPEVEVDGVQRGRQRHPLPLAVDDGRERSPRWRWEAAEGLYWHLEGDGVSRRVGAVPKPLCCRWEPPAPCRAPGGVGRDPDPGLGVEAGLE